MDLIGYHKDVVFKGDVGDPLKFILFPNSSYGIVRRAENVYLYIIFRDLFFKCIKVNGISSVIIPDKFIPDKFSAVIAHRFGKGIIYRLRYHNGISGIAEGQDCGRDPEHGSGRKDYRIGIGIESVSSLIPLGDDPFIGRLWIRITEESGGSCFDNRIRHLRRGRKIHIRNPERKLILRMMPFLRKIPLQRICISSVVNFIKIISHVFILFFHSCIDRLPLPGEQ